MQLPGSPVDSVEMSHLASSTIKVGPHPERLEGTYRNRPAYFALWVGCIAVVPLVVAALVLRHDPAWIGGGILALVATLAGAVLIGRRGVRPRFEVSRDGVVVVNPAQLRRLTWDQIEAFQCRQTLVVRTTEGEQIHVWALPSRVWGGPVAALTERLNSRPLTTDSA
jgi:Bacterial PH domain